MRDPVVLMNAAKKLKERNIKNTPQRQVILSYLMSSKEHPSIEMIQTYVKENGFSVSLATVYNTLELFMKEKLIIEVTPDSHGKMRYDYFGEPHYHVICVRCNKIIDVYDDAYTKLEADASKKTGYHVFSSQYEVYGLCPKCQEEIKNQNLTD